MKKALVSALFALVATAAPAAEFPSTVVLKVGQSAAGSWNMIAQVVGDHLGRFLPGEPSIAVETVDGGRGMQLARQMAETEPGDGSVLGTMPMTVMQSALLEPSTFDFSVEGIHWVGALAKTVAYCVKKEGANVALSDKGVVLGATTKRSNFYANASLLKHLVNPDIEIILGFRGETELMAALDRGEIQAYCGVTRSTYERQDRESTQDILGGVGSSEGLAAAGVQDIFASVTDELDRQAIALAINSSVLFYSFALPADADPEVVATYRDAFARMCGDPAFRSDIEAKMTEYAPSSGEEVQDFVSAMMNADPAVVARAVELLQ